MVTVAMLKRAVELQSRVETMQKEIASLLAGKEVEKVQVVPSRAHKMSKAGSKAIAEAQKLRHAKARQLKEEKLRQKEAKRLEKEQAKAAQTAVAA